MSEQIVKPYSPAQERFGNVVVKLMSRLQTWIYRASGGKMANKFLQGAPVALLTHIGRKSGEERTTPLIFIEEGEDVIIVASKGGFAESPQWYFNLMENENAKLQIGDKLREMVAREATAEEVERAWPRLLEIYSDFAEYKLRAQACDRVIPLVVLSPTSG